MADTQKAKDEAIPAAARSHIVSTLAGRLVNNSAHGSKNEAVHVQVMFGLQCSPSRKARSLTGMAGVRSAQRDSHQDW
eukprot:8125626-Pyramimonas_sp.AAC.2